MASTYNTNSTILSVNVPNVALQDYAGTQITRLGTRHAAEPVVKEIDPRGRDIFWIGRPGKSQDVGIGTDFYALENNYVSITPLKIDLTDYQAMEQLSQWANTDS